MNTNNKEGATININLNGLSEAGASKPNEHALWPWPWPFPFPFPRPTPFPFPLPGGPFGPGPILRTDGSVMDDDDLYLHGVTIGLSMKVQKGIKVDDMHEELCEKVLPRLIKARSIEEIDDSMKSAYKAYPKLKEQVHQLYGELGGGEEPEVQAMNPIVWWIAKKVVKVIVVAVATALTAKPLK